MNAEGQERLPVIMEARLGAWYCLQHHVVPFEVQARTGDGCVG